MLRAIVPALNWRQKADAKVLRFAVFRQESSISRRIELLEIAIKTVRDYLAENNSIDRVIFNVFGEEDHSIYRSLLGL